MSKNKLVSPVLKWVGGKRQLLPSIKSLLPKRITSYCEPFVGGGAVLFDLQPKKAIVNDINSDLIHVYTVIRDDVDALSKYLKPIRTRKVSTMSFVILIVINQNTIGLVTSKKRQGLFFSIKLVIMAYIV